MDKHTSLFAPPVLKRLIVATLLLAAGLFAAPAQAEIPQPEHIFYGTVSRNGELVLAGEVTVVLDGQAAPLGRFELGSKPAYGDRYVLRLPLDFGEPRSPDTARPGELARLYLDGELAATAEIGEPGGAQVIDLDPFFDDPPELGIGDTEVVEGDSRTVRADFEVRLSRPVPWDVTVAYATADGSATAGSVAAGGDYTAAAGTLTIAAGETRATISVDVHGETVVEPPEEFFVDLSGPVGAVVTAGRGRGRISADDTRYVVYAGDAEVLEGDGGDVEAVLTVRVTSEVPGSSLVGGSVTVRYHTVDGSATSEEDYQAASGQLNIDTGVVCGGLDLPCGEIRVRIDPDNRREGPETFTIVLSEVDDGVLGDDEGEVVIVDDELFLTFVEAERDGVDGVGGLRGAAAVMVSPDGRHVYSAAQLDGSLSVFERQPASGQLAYVASVADTDATIDGLGGVEGLAISPDGGYVYAAGFLDDAVAVFSRDATSGALTFVEARFQGGGVDGLRGAAAVAVSPEGTHLYAVGHKSAAVAVFSRDATSGALTFASVARDGAEGVDGLTGAEAVALSPDGSHLYVASSVDSAVVVFERDPDTGRLSFVELEKDGVQGVDGLNGATAVAVSGDGHQVYVAGYLDGAVAVFSRDGASGALTFLERKKDGFGHVTGLGGAAAVAVSNDGGFVYVAGETDSALALFRRDPTSGRLTFLEARYDGELDRRGRLEGLAGATGLALSSDAADAGSRHVYVAGQADDALAVFAHDTVAPDPPLLESTSHQPGVWSSRPVVTVEWIGAADPDGVGLSGYSFVFDSAPDTVPDVELELVHETDLQSYSATSDPLPDGDSHRFHLRVCDHADNCNAPVRVGPFFVDTTPPAPPQDLVSTSHEVGVAIRRDVLEMAWTPAVDAGSGVDGYGFVVDTAADGPCVEVRELDAAARTVAVGPLATGTWYFHLCAVDRLGHWSSVASAGPYPLEAVPPFVTRVDTVSATAGGLGEGASPAGAVTQLLVTFSKAMNDPGGDGAFDDVTNPAGYTLARPDADGNATGCVADGGDPSPVAVDAALYHPATSTVALRVNGDVSLPPGSYRLFVCPGLTDTFGNQLDGNHDGQGGDRFRRTFEVVAGNLVRNPNFDDGLAPWLPSGQMAAEVTFSGDDADGAWSSGSAWLENLTGPGEVLVLSQCVDLTDVTGRHRLAGRARNAAPPFTSALSAAAVLYFDGADCSGDQLDEAMVTVEGSTGGAWQPFEVFSSVPAGARSARVALSVAAGPEPDFGVTAHFDNVVFQPSSGPLFRDGFESGDLSLWSSSVP